jgi:hypothetical protein
MTTAISTKDARKALVSAYHNKRVVTWEDRKLIREATQGLSRFEAPATPRKPGA